MARSISDSISLLETSVEDIKTSLETKLNDDRGGITSLKISEVAGYIDQIETGGGSGFNCVENVKSFGEQIQSPFIISRVVLDDQPQVDLKFTPKLDGLRLFMSGYLDTHLNLEPSVNDGGVDLPDGGGLSKGTEYHITGEAYEGAIVITTKSDYPKDEPIPMDAFIFNIL